MAGGCLKTKQVNPGEPVGTDWTDIVQDILKNGASGRAVGRRR